MKVAASVSLLVVGSANAFAPSKSATSRVSTSTNAAMDDLKAVAAKANPVLKYFDPIGLAGQEFWGTTSDETIGFLRESEVKHGRIAMFAFVGYIVHANGIHFPWAMELDGTPFPSVSSAPEAWDSISDTAKLQIFAFIGFLEYWREVAGDKHYMKGGKIGEFPAFDSSVIPGGALNYFDPFGFSKKRSAADKEAGLIKELNNGRLAMIGMFGFLCEAKIEGSVPALKGLIPAYDGEFMAPMSTNLFPHL